MPIGANFTAIWRILPWSRAWGQGLLELHRFGKCGNPNPNDNIFVYFRRPNSISKRNKSTQQTRNYLPKYTSTYPSMYRIYIYIFTCYIWVYSWKMWTKTTVAPGGPRDAEPFGAWMVSWPGIDPWWLAKISGFTGKTYGETLGKPMAKP